MNRRSPIVFATGALWCLAGAVLGKPVPTPAVAPQGAAVQVVQQYLTARSAGQTDKAYALISTADRAQLPPVDQRDKLLQSLTDPQAKAAMPPNILPVLALFLDMRDTLHFKFRVLGVSPEDPNVVLVRTYQVGTPLSSIKVIKVVTVPDPDAGGALRLDGEKTAARTDPRLAVSQQAAQQAASQSNLKQIGLAIMQYTQDNNETLPDAGKWVDEIMPYLKTEAVFHDPASPDAAPWSYAYNKAFSGVKLADVPDPSNTVLVFESTLRDKNASDDGTSVPRPGRHNGGTDYAFADGHVKWQADGSKPAFTLRGASTP